MNRLRLGLRLLTIVGGLVLALGAMVGVASADDLTVQGTVTADGLLFAGNSGKLKAGGTVGTIAVDGKLTVSNDLIANYPIYVNGNLIKYKGNANTVLDFNRSDSKIYVDSNLVLHTDNLLVVDAGTLQVNKALDVFNNSLFRGDVEFRDTGGNGVKPDARFRGYAVFDGSAEFNGAIDLTDATVSGLNALSGDLTITSGARIGTGSTPGLFTALADDSLFVEGQLEVDGAAQVDGALAATSTLAVTGTSTLTGLVTATAGVTTPVDLTTTGTGDLVSADDLTVADVSTLTGLVTATAGVTTPANLTTTGMGDLVSADDLTVADAATITGASTLTGAVTTGAALTVGTDLTVTGNDLIFGNAERIVNTTDGTVAITDGTNNLLTVVDAGTTGNVTATGTLTVDGVSTLTGAVTASAGLTATTGGVTVTAGGLTVTAGGATITAGALAVNSDSITSDGDLTIDVTGGQVLLADTDVLNIGGVSALAYNAISNAAGAAGAAAVAADNDLFVQGDVEVDGTVTFDGAVTYNAALSVTDLTLTGDLAVNGDDITSDGDLTINPAGGQVLLADTDVLNIGGVSALAYNALANAGGAAGAAAVAADNDLYVQGDVEVDGTVTFDGTVTATSTLAVTGTSTLTGLVTATAGVTTSTNLTTTGTGDLVSADDLTVADAATITGAATFNGAVTLGDAAADVITSTGNFTAAGTLAVTGNTTLTGDLAVNGDDITSDGVLTVSATGYTRIGDTATPGSATGDDALFVEGGFEVDGASTLDGTLSVTGASTFNGAVTMNSSLTGSGTLTWSGTASLTGSTTITNLASVTVAGASDLRGAVANSTGVLNFNDETSFTPTATTTTNVQITATATTADAVDLNAVTVTTGRALDITATGLTTGAALNVDTGTARTSGAALTIDDDSVGATVTGDLIQIDVAGTPDTNLLDFDITGVTTGNTIDVTYSSGASTGNAIDLNMGTNVAGDAVNIASAATTGNALDITSSGIFTNDLIDINVGAQAATGDVMNISLGATAVAAQALVVDSGGASSTDGWVLAGDNSGNGIWTGDMINLRSGTGDASGDFIDLTFEAGATDAQGITFNNAAASDQAGWGLHFLSSAAFTSSMIAFDNTANSIWTGDLINVTTGTGDASGDIIDMTFEAGATDVQGIVVTNAAASDQAGWLMDVDTSAAWTGIAMDIDIAGAVISTGNFLDVAYATGAHTGNAIDLNMGTNVAGDAINIASIATTGNALDITASGVFTNELIDINIGAVAATGDVINIAMGATAVAAQAIVVNSGGAMSTDGWVLAADNGLDAIWTGDMINLRSGTGDASGDFIDLTFEAGATDAQGIVFNNAAATDQVGWGLSFLSSAAFTSSMIAFDNTANSIWTGDLISITTGTGDASGVFFAGTIEAGATDVQAFQVTNAAASDQAGWLMDVDTSAAWTGIGMDIDIAGAVISTGNFLDVTYATGAHTGNAIDLNMGTDVTGNALDIATAATTGNAIDITTTGVFTNDLIDINVGAQAATGDVMNIALGATAVAAQALVVDSGGASSTDGWVLSGDNSGNGIWTGDMINLRSGTGDASGDFIDITMEALATDVQGIVINNAAATDQVGWGLQFLSSAAFTSSMIAFDNTANSIWTGDLINVTTGTGDASGDIIDITFEAGATDVQAIVLTNSAATDQAGWFANISSGAAFTSSMIAFDNTANSIWTGDLINVTTGTGDVSGDIIDMTFEAGATDVQGIVINNAAATDQAGWGLSVLSSAAFTASMIQFDNTANSIWTGNLIDVDTGTGDVSGNIVDLNFEAGATDVQALVLNNAAATDQAGWLMDINTTGIWTGIAIDVDFATVASTGNFLDIAYADAAHTGDTIAIATGTNLAGNAMQVTTAGARTAPVFFVDGAGTDGGVDDHIIDIDQSGLLNSNVLDITYSSGASDGNAIDLNMGTNIAGDAININQANATTGDGLVMVNNASATAAYTGNMVFLDFNQTHAEAAADDDTGVLFRMTRDTETTDAGGTLTVSGDMASLINTGTQTAGTLTQTARMLFIDQNYAASTGDLVEIENASGADALFIDQDGVGGVAINIDSEATTGNVMTVTAATTSGNFIDLTTEGIWTTELIDINVGAQAATGDVMNVALGATAVAAQALVIDSGGASTTDGWVLAGDNSGNGIWTGDMINLRSGTGDASGDFIDITMEALATDVQGIVINNAAATDQVGWGLQFLSSAAFTSSMIAFDNTANSIWTGDLISITTGTGDASGVFFAGTIEAGATDVQAFQVTNAAASDQAGWLLDVDTSAAWTGIGMDIDIAGAVISTGNFLDVTYASGAHTGNAIDLNMGTNVAGDAINIGGALTTGQAIAVSVTGTHTEASSGIVVLTATGVLDNPTSLTDIDGSGVLRLSAEGEQDDYALIVADGEVVFSNTSNLSFDSQIFTSAGAGTLTPTSTFVVADNTAAEAALTLGETGVQDGQLLIIAIDVTSAAAYTIADTDGVANTSAALTLGVGDTVVFIYDAIALEWVQLATSNN